jgi:transcriptional regulator with XRE-family HTH domain
MGSQFRQPPIFLGRRPPLYDMICKSGRIAAHDVWMEHSTQDVAGRIRSRRLVRGLNQFELAAEAGVHRTAVARAESGYPCRPTTLRKIAIALGTTLTWLRRPFYADNNYRLDTAAETLWVATNPSFIRRKGIEARKSLRDPDERLRLGTLGLANAFVRVLNVDLPGGRVNALVVESYRKELEPVSYPGQMFLYVLKGKIKLTVGSQEVEMGPDDAASYWNDEPNLYEALDGEPATILEVFVALSDHEIALREKFGT